MAGAKNADASEERLYERVITAVKETKFPKLALRVLSWAISARISSPRVAADAAGARAILRLFDRSDITYAFAVESHTDGRLSLIVLNEDLPARTIENASGTLRITSTDHVRGCSGDEKTTLFLYADVGGNDFGGAYRMARQRNPCHVLRHWRGKSDINAQPVALQGYAVHAAVKATEYRVVDDRVFKHRLFPDEAHGTDAIHSDAAVDGALDMEAFKEPFVGVSAALSVSKSGSDKVWEALSELAGDAPVALRSAVEQHQPSSDERRAATKIVKAVRQLMGQGDVVIVNGRMLDVSQAVSQSLPSTLRCLSSITSVGAAMTDAGIERQTISNLLHKGGDNEGSGIELRVKLQGAGDLTVWYNDLTKDKRYKSWDTWHNDTQAVGRYVDAVKKSGEPQHANDFSTLVKVRANLLEFVLALDPGDPQQLSYLNIPEQIVRGDLPFRAGLILVPNDEVSTMMAAGFHFFRLSSGKKAAVAFLNAVSQILEYMGGGFQRIPLSTQVVELAFQQVAGDGGTAYSNLMDIVEKHDEVKKLLEKAREWARKNGLFVKSEEVGVGGGVGESEKNDSQAFSMLSTINGILLNDISEILPKAVEEQRRLAKHLKVEDVEGESTDWAKRDDSLVVVNRVTKTMLSSRQRDVMSQNEKAKRVSLVQLKELGEEMKEVKYIREEQVKSARGAVTVWLATCNEESKTYVHGMKVVKEFVEKPFAARSNVRVGVIPAETKLARKIVTCSEKDDDDGTVLLINGRIVGVAENMGVEDVEAEVAAEYLSKASRVSGSSWDHALLGAVGLHEIDATCSGSDEKSVEIEAILKHIDEKIPDGERFVVPGIEAIRQGTKKSLLSVVAICDPLGVHSTATAEFLRAISRTFGEEVFIGSIFAPATGLGEEVPNARQVFSRFVLASEPAFEKGRLVSPRARFARMPQRRILTIDVKQPRAWFIASYSTNYDMDNVILADLPDNVATLHAEYRLESLLVEGSCVDERGSPPQGLQLAFGAQEGTRIDTTVMANLGYFQLRVPEPGKWSLRLAEGRSREIFDIKSVDDRLSGMYGAAGASAHTFAVGEEGGFDVSVDSLDGACGTLLRVARQAGKEGMKLVGEEEEEKKVGHGENAIRKVTSLVTGIMGKKREKKKDIEETINVFSVASGHLYERLMKIMMLSVTKHASRPVKFWLLENYLSPGFKRALPEFAKERGFEVGFVTYRWPGWLREQSEKQRVIWAYKILFLDVLFPLKVGRIIFVDADQVARADLAELMDMDLEGAPYGYVPFCDSRKEVEGYRFWKSGFWEKTLQGQKYRISALYVVDLKRLRSTAAGDSLRSIYQSLSADPNSLSNLDQDLPNYASAAHALTGSNVPIFDLPQEWLWCESWCDDESKASAKTIDLCNNPASKEEKTKMAVRVVEEWPALDEEASMLTEKIYSRLVGAAQVEIEGKEEL